jgi:hypothetical protein
MKTYNEWLNERGEGENTDATLVDDQASMMMDRFIGLLHGLTSHEKKAIVEKAINTLSKLVQN